MEKIPALVLALVLPATALAGSLEFKRNGKIVGSHPIEAIQKGSLGKLKAVDLELFNAWRGYSRVYVGYDFFKVLDLVYGKAWRKSYAVKFVAQDGYLSHSKIKPMLKAAAGKTGLLSYKEKDKDGFTSVQKGDKSIDPGPIYLVWSNFSEKDKATYVDVLKWPFQLKEIDVVDALE